VIERIFDAPRELVWKTWTDPEQVMRWWGPQYFTSPVCKIDLRVGGSYLYCMRSPEGQDFWSTGVYHEIVMFERIVCTIAFSDAQGNIIAPTQVGFGDDVPLELLDTITFEVFEQNKTRLTLRRAGIPAGQMREMTVAGWNTSMDKFAASLKA